MPDFDRPPAHDSLVRTIRHFKRDFISPSEMWNPLFETLTPESARGFLDSLPDDLKAVIREEYNGLARYRFEPPLDAEFREVKQVIARWCEATGGGS